MPQVRKRVWGKDGTSCRRLSTERPGARAALRFGPANACAFDFQMSVPS